METTYTKSEIYAIIDHMIQEEMLHKNRFIELNGYKHSEILDRFDNHIAALTSLYGKF